MLGSLRAVDRLIGRAGDVLLDAAVVAFALWTLVYDVDLAAHVGTSSLLIVWALLCALAAAVAVVRRWRRAPLGHGAADVPAQLLPPRRPGRAWWWLATAALASTVTVALRATSWAAAWVPAAAVVAMSLVAHMRSHGGLTRAWAPSYAGSGLAALAALGVAAVTPFTAWLSNDDVYYVNRSVWIAAHGAIPLRDTIFGNQTLPAMSGQQVPIASIEALQGALAHAFGIAAPSVVYLATPPVAAALAVWALWRLVRAWAPRTPLLGFAVALVWVLWSTQLLTTQWNFHLAGMWQGKSMLVGIVIPWLFVQLTRWLVNPRPAVLLALLAAGAAAVGCSSSGVFVVPLVAAAAALPALARRDLRRLAGPLAAALYPAAAGLAVHVSLPASGPGTGGPYGAPDVVRFVVGTGAVGVIGLTAVLAARHVQVVRAPAELTLGVAAVAVLVVMPGMPEAFNALTGAGPVLWRALWVAPLAGMVAVAVALPGPLWARLAAPVATAALLLGAGTAPWAARNPVRFVGSPRWDIDPAALAEARLVAAAAPRGSVVLAPAPVMQALAQTTVRVYTAAPRDVYALSLDDRMKRNVDRVVLAHWSYALRPPVFLTPDELAAALADVRVDYTCVARGVRGRILHEAGFGPPTQVGSLLCFSTSTARPSPTR